VGRFVDLWDARGATVAGILHMLIRNNILIPHEYVYRRVGSGNIDSNSNLRSTFCEDSSTSRLIVSSRAGHTGWADEIEEDDDVDHRQSWESDLELWFEEH